MRDKIYLISICTLLIIGISLFIKPQKISSYLERRNMATLDSLKDKSLSNGAFQSGLDDFLTDQFYAKDNIIKLYYKKKLFLYSPFMDELVKLEDDVIKMGDYYIKNLLEYDHYIMETVKNRGYNIQEVASIYNNIPFYVYKPTRIEETELLNTDSIYSFGTEYEDAFKGQLSSVEYMAMEINDLESYKEMYYKTDIHWNIKGAYQGYSDIIGMLNKSFMIGEPKEIENMYCFGSDFYGATSNKIAQQTEPEAICDYRLANIGEYVYYVNGNMDQGNPKDEYKNGLHNRIFSDYDNYYGANDYERIYDFGDNTGYNLLMIVDSFVNPNKEWIASHFDKTVLLDLRSLTDRESFSLDNYLEKYGIDAVVITMYYDNLYFNGYNFIPVR